MKVRKLPFKQERVTREEIKDLARLVHVLLTEYNDQQEWDRLARRAYQTMPSIRPDTTIN